MKTMLPLVAACALLVTSARAQNITFTPTDRTVPFPAHSFIQGDINRDGIPDFLGVSPGSQLYAFKSDGIGNYVPWVIPTAYCPASPLAFGDFAHNWKNDLLVSTIAGAACSGGQTGSFSDYLNNGFGKFLQSKQVPLTSSAALAAVTADFTGDKKLDAVVLDGNNLELFSGDGQGGFTGPSQIATLTGSAASQTGGFYNVIAGDYDGNGCPDVAWLEREASANLEQVHVAYGDCAGGFTIGTPYAIAGQIDNIQTTDLDRDGVSDIVGTVDAFGGGANGPTLGIAYGQRDRTFILKLIGDPSLTGPLAAADFNGDGYPDIAYISTSASGSEIKILQGDPTQSFAGISTYPLPDANGTPEQFAFGDYNRDGKMDLALLSTGTSGSPVFTILTNTSAYPGGACVVPILPGVHVCSPGRISGPTVNVLAAGKSVDPAVFMELWVDGVKQVQYGSTSEMRATLDLTPGWHRLGFYAIDAAAIRAHEVRYVFVLPAIQPLSDRK
ncbi:MAG TPA: VCBS repeat-containing protein [Acidobacteriaceae bacterium]